MMERVKGSVQAGPDGGRACGRELLAAHDMRQADKARLAPPERGHAGQLEDGFKPRVLFDERVDRGFEVGLAVEVEGHDGLETPLLARSFNAVARLPLCA